MTTSLASSLTSVDCQLDTAVTVAYSRFFGHGGMFSVALTLTLTIYVAVVAMRLLTGHTHLTLRAMTPRILALGLVLTFATAWPAYQTVVFNLLARGPDQIAAALLGNSGGATHAFAQQLDRVFDSLIDLAQSLDSKGQQGQSAARWVWASTLLLMLSTAGLLLVIKVVLAVLLALGPSFIVFALFDGTRGLFEGWLKTSIAFALAPLLTVIGGVGAMTLFAPITDGLLDDPAALTTDMKPVFMLFAGTVIYAAILLTLFWTAVSLVRHWRSPLGHMAAALASNPAGSSMSTVVSGVEAASSVSAAIGATDARVASMLVAVTRNSTLTADPTRVVVTAAANSRSEPGAAPVRGNGLGQARRIQSQKRGFSGRIKA